MFFLLFLVATQLSSSNVSSLTSLLRVSPIGARVAALQNVVGSRNSWHLKSLTLTDITISMVVYDTWKIIVYHSYQSWGNHAQKAVPGWKLFYFDSEK